MTREEIIGGLQMTMDLIQFDPGTGNVRPIYELNDLDKTTYLACKEAIEALKAQMDRDTISRQDAIDAVEKSRRLNHHRNGKEACAHEYEHRHFLKILRDLPPAQPESQSICNNLATDCISRQAAIDELYKMLHDCFWADDEELDAVITTLNDLPPIHPDPSDVARAIATIIEPERKIGEWKHISDGYVDIYECNQCGKTEDYKRNYCPDCGAYMKKENKIIKKY